MSRRPDPSRFDRGAVVALIGAVAVSLALVVVVLVPTNPFGGYVAASPAIVGTLLFGALTVAVGYAAHALRRR